MIRIIFMVGKLGTKAGMLEGLKNIIKAGKLESRKAWRLKDIVILNYLSVQSPSS
jgi:hypothetical protein